jgi:hypothetical protein
MKPVLWIHKASGRIRFQGEGLPNSWMPLYAKENLELDPLQREDTPDLTDKARRIWDYVKNRKVSFEAVTVAEHFSNSTAAITKHLNTLYAAGMLTRTRKANKVFWAVKHVGPKETESKPTEAPVAVSKPSVKPQPSRPAPVIWPSTTYKKQTSYPNIRGYDD